MNSAVGWSTVDLTAGVVSPGLVQSEGCHPLLLEEFPHTDEGLASPLPSRWGDTPARKLVGPEQ